jgi:DNA ligase-associated metallophosphoesterase
MAPVFTCLFLEALFTNLPLVTLKKSVKDIVYIQNEKMHLLSQRALYWEAQKTLLLADLHLGKVNHFRKAGLPVPVKANEKNVELLLEIIQLTKPERVIFLGDLFHSHYNEEWEVFGQLLKNFPTISFELVVGNHDILSDHQYQKLGIIMHQELQLGPFLLTHHPLENYAGELYNLAGHVHPGARLVGKGRQSLTLPCFHFGKQQGLLPAFGAFTGLSQVSPKKNDQIFVIVEDKILKV